jgi:hypothetical protein
MIGHIRTRRHERPNADKAVSGNWLLISEAKNGVPEVRYALK